MEFKNLRSSRIKQTAYVDAENTLVIVFNNNISYDYLNVPKKVFLELIKSKSPGSYFEQNIKGKYAFEKN